MLIIIGRGLPNLSHSTPSFPAATHNRDDLVVSRCSAVPTQGNEFKLNETMKAKRAIQVNFDSDGPLVKGVEMD